MNKYVKIGIIGFTVGAVLTTGHYHLCKYYPEKYKPIFPVFSSYENTGNSKLLTPASESLVEIESVRKMA